MQIRRWSLCADQVLSPDPSGSGQVLMRSCCRRRFVDTLAICDFSVREENKREKLMFCCDKMYDQLFRESKYPI